MQKKKDKEKGEYSPYHEKESAIASTSITQENDSSLIRNKSNQRSKKGSACTWRENWIDKSFIL